MKENEEIVAKTFNLLRKASHVVFSDPFWGALETLGRFWVTFWSLWDILVTKSLPKVAQRLRKVFQKRANGSKAAQKGSKKTTWPAFLDKFDVFLNSSYFISYWLLFGSYWRLLAPIGSSWLLSPSICSCCLLLSPIASSLLLLSPFGS